MLIVSCKAPVTGTANMLPNALDAHAHLSVLQRVSAWASGVPFVLDFVIADFGQWAAGVGGDAPYGVLRGDICRDAAWCTDASDHRALFAEFRVPRDRSAAPPR